MIGNTDIRRVAKVVPVDGVAELLPGLQKILDANPDAVVAITNQGKPVMALLPWESWEDTEDLAASMETLEILADPDAAAAIRQAEADVTGSNVVPWEEVQERLIADGLLDEAER